METKFRNGRGFEQPPLLRATKGVKIGHPFPAEIKNHASTPDVQSEVKRIGRNKPSSEEPDDQGIFEFMIVALRTGAVDHVSDDQNRFVPGGALLKDNLKSIGSFPNACR